MPAPLPLSARRVGQLTEPLLSPATARFVEYFGDLGPRWGLPADACRMHAFIYVLGRPVKESEISEALDLNMKQLTEALDYLREFQVVAKAAPFTWNTSGDPLEMLLTGLEARKQRELPLALSTLESCRNEAITLGGTSADQIEKMLDLVRGLGALDAQFQRLPKALVKRFLNMAGRTAQAFNGSTRGRHRGGRYEP